MPFDINLDGLRAGKLIDQLRIVDKGGMAAADLQKSIDGMNASLGYKSGEGPIKYEGGKLKIGDTDVDMDSINRDSLNAQLSAEIKSPDELKQVQDALANQQINPTTDQVQNATQKGASGKPTQAEALTDRFNQGGAPTTAAAQEARFTEMMNELKKSNPSFMQKVLKYTVLAGAGFLALFAASQAKKGCYVSYDNDQTLVYHASAATGDPQAGCKFILNNAINSANNVYTTCSNQCPSYISNSAPPAQNTTDVSKLSAGTCNCEVNGTAPASNVNLVYEDPTVWDMFGSIINGIGGFITQLANGALQAIDTLANLVGDLPKILMWVGIGAAIIAVIAGLAFLGKKLHDKSKQKKLQQGKLAGGREQFKRWQKSMKQVQKKTPVSYFSNSLALF